MIPITKQDKHLLPFYRMLISLGLYKVEYTLQDFDHNVEGFLNNPQIVAVHI